MTPGGGGRVALVVTNAGADFSLYTGPILAQGPGNAGSGTIYKQRASDPPGWGTVLVLNGGNGYTEVPPNPPNVTNEVEFTTFYVTNSARLRLTNDFLIGNIFMQSSNAWLDLGSNTLWVKSRAHALGPGFVTNYGAIVWCPDIPKGVVFSVW